MQPAGFMLVWLGDNGVGHVNEVKLRQARLVRGLVIIFAVCRLVAGHLLLNGSCTRLPECIRLQNDLYCFEWGIVKLYSLIFT